MTRWVYQGCCLVGILMGAGVKKTVLICQVLPLGGCRIQPEPFKSAGCAHYFMWLIDFYNGSCRDEAHGKPALTSLRGAWRGSVISAKNTGRARMFSAERGRAWRSGGNQRTCLSACAVALKTASAAHMEWQM